jgi:hypothetical protein
MGSVVLPFLIALIKAFVAFVLRDHLNGEE